MKAWTFDAPAIPTDLRLVDLPIPEPAADELRVRVCAVGLNPADWKVLQRPDGPLGSRVAGMDAAGYIDTVGAGVRGWSEGERVHLHTGIARLGAFAQSVCVPAWSVARVPAAMDLCLSAALPTPGWTAYQLAHHRLRLVPGMRVLVLGAAGAVGAYCLQLAVRLGAQVTASSAATAAGYLRELGAQEALDGRTPPGMERLAEIAPEGFDVVIDVYGPDSAARALRLLRFGGQLACCAGSPAFSSTLPIPRGLSVHDILFSGAPLFGDAGPQGDWQPIGEALACLVDDGEVRMPQVTRIEFDALPLALDKLRRGQAATKFIAMV